MAQLEAFDLMGWIDANQDKLKPPVGNHQLYKETHRNFIIMVIGGPNQRTDYHDDASEELFYQLKGDIVLRVIGEDGRPEDIPIREGQMLLLPPHVRHSPQRPAGSVGLVVERVRMPGEVDAFEWYCEVCHFPHYRREVEVGSIEKDLPPVFEAYYGDAASRTCPRCGHQNAGRPGA